jgi:hypothetical protein
MLSEGDSWGILRVLGKWGVGSVNEGCCFCCRIVQGNGFVLPMIKSSTIRCKVKKIYLF